MTSKYSSYSVMPTSRLQSGCTPTCWMGLKTAQLLEWSSSARLAGRVELFHLDGACGSGEGPTRSVAAASEARPRGQLSDEIRAPRRGGALYFHL